MRNTISRFWLNMPDWLFDAVYLFALLSLAPFWLWAVVSLLMWAEG